ncbi:MAG: hypothetical protein A2Y02_03020 [Omnitrophica bacterium GWA2_52_12]|nr:MAG: hypothetical protein A2Y02_03020 [Omnitrophica bacterium GWA2_52_12]
MIRNTILSKCQKRGYLQRGTSLIELIFVVVLLAAMVLSFTKLFMDVSVTSTSPQYRLTGTLLAQELMEEIKSRRFDENEAKTADGNWSKTLGTDSGETTGSRASLDDVDDYQGLSENLSTPFNGFSRSVSVAYVNQDSLNTPLAIPGTVPNDWTPDYKRVQVTVSQGGSQRAQLVTIVGSAKSRDTLY